MSLTTVTGIHSVFRIGQLYNPNNELMGRVVEARNRDSYNCFYTVKLSFQNLTSQAVYSLKS